RRRGEQDARIRLIGRVEDEDVQRVSDAAVGFVLPYRDIFNSGSLFLALSMGRPALVPASDVFAETQALVGQEWVQMFEPPLTAPDLERFTAHAAALVAEGRRPDLDRFAWDRLGPGIVAFYRRLLDEPDGWPRP